MASPRNARLFASTPLLLSHPPVTYDSLVDFDRSFLPLAAAQSQHAPVPVGDTVWLDDDDIVQQLTHLPVPYFDLLSSGAVDEREVELLQDLFEPVRLDGRLLAVEKRMAEYVALFHRLLSTVTDGRVQSQLVAALQSLIEADEAIQQAFVVSINHPDCDIVSSLMRLLQSALDRPEQYRELPPHFLPCRLCEVVTTLLQATLPSAGCTTHEHRASDSPVRDYVEWLMSVPLAVPPSECNLPLLAAAFESLRSLVYFPPLLAFFHERDGLLRLSPLLVPSIAAEPYQYNLAFLLWLCSFSSRHWDDFLSLKLLPHLINLLSVSRSEKCIRLYLRILRSLAQHSVSALSEYLVEAALPSHLHSLSQRQWRDVEMVPLIGELQGRLDAAQCELSSWSLYRSELLSSSLHLSPPHTSAAFFRSNFEHFAANHAAVVRRLLGVLDDHRVCSVSRAVAASDLGHLATCGSAGKRLLLDVGGVKEALLRFASKDEEADSSVRRAAVEALQKLLVPRWEEFEKHCTLDAAHLAERPPLRLPERPVAITFETKL